METFGVQLFKVFIVTIQLIPANCMNGRDKGGNCTFSGNFYGKSTNECKECPPGYLPLDHCSCRCRYPGFGKNCQEECLCNEEYCDFQMGCTKSTDNSTHYNETNLSSGPVTITERTNIITIVTITASALVFLSFLILSKIILIRRKTRHTAAQANTSASFEENDLHNVLDEFPSGVGTQNLGMEGANPITEDLQMMKDENPTGFERNMGKKKTKILKKNSDVTNIRETENIYTLAFASFGSVMMEKSVHDYSPLQFN